MENVNKPTDEMLFRYFSGQLAGEEEKEMLEWFEADPSASVYLAERAEWWALLHVPRFAAGRESNFEAHFGWLHPRADRSEKFSLLRWRPLLAVAAVAAGLVIVGALAYRVGIRTTGADRPIAAAFEASTPLGSTSRLVLADGTVVWLNAGSTLSVPRLREVQLEGEAFFEVAPDSLAPFIVRSENLRVRVTGTRFDVRAYPDEETVDVALVSGKVHVRLEKQEPGLPREAGGADSESASARSSSVIAPGSSETAAHNSKEVTLRPDRMLSYNKETHLVLVSGINGADVFAWTGGKLKFSNRPFRLIAKDLERKFNVPIRIESRTLGGEVFTGSFSSEHSLDKILREVDVEHKYRWRHEEGCLVIRDK